ncbi:maleate cis-trans isomerase [Amycolatopsis bartoniae]|uniref:Arylmalonate decarboxylase n=1 Tax=Amycolatopsis bartoniae TaxID=941986 RepID=A0A8H9IXN6_9PSEU|nr:maleate cis-trans isomerase [Amycolatopsis bartoniae]MBB2934480.1 maleate cis-trans isomerase [Amycolatopsis bartoniae]TVT02212.1 maleate cis-trans isomerase [Amycolatopsis bartoniae]GHF47089.1 arylmalonate decarboxylase [Amycolatopsis bartoniae]
MPTVGFIYPDHAAEDDYPFAEQLLGPGFSLPVEHIYGTDLHAVPELLDLGSEERLAEGASLLAKHEPDVVVWACTSGSFVYRWEGAQEQVDKLAAVAGKPASSTSFAFVRAAAKLGLKRVAVAASYPEDVAKLFVEFLGRGGIEIVAMSSAGIDTAAEVGTLAPESVVDFAVFHDHPAAEAVLVPDTAMRTLGVIPTIEARLGKPVLTANQVTIWEGLRLAGTVPESVQLGELFQCH